MTENETAIKKQKIADYCKKRNEELSKYYSKYYFTTAEDFVRLVDYHPYRFSTDIKKELAGIGHLRIQRETVETILEVIRQLNHIIGTGFTRTYKQELLDSDEINNLLVELLEQGEFSRVEKIDRYEFAQKLFNSSMKILIDEAPEPIKKYLVKHIHDFYDMATIPTQLGVKQKRELVRPWVTVRKITGDVKVRLRTQLEEKKPTKSPRAQLEEKKLTEDSKTDSEIA